MIKVYKIGFRKYIIETNLYEEQSKKFDNALQKIFPKIKFIVLNNISKNEK